MSNITLNPVRYYTDQDVYHYTVDNRPLQDLASNDVILANAIQSLSASIGAGLYTETFNSGTDFVAGTSTTLTLLNSPSTASGVWVFFDGVYQDGTTYFLSSGIVTFSSPIPLGVSAIEVKWTTTLLGAVSGGGSSGVTNVVNNLSGLRNFVRGSVTMMMVLGGSAPGDGQGEVYYFDGTDATSTDNGGTVIRAYDSSCWKSAYLNPYNPVTASALSGSEGIMIIQNGKHVKISASALTAFIQSGLAPQRQTILATSAGQATYVTNGYTAPLVNVFIAGTRLDPSEYTATDGTNIVITNTDVLSQIQIGTPVSIESVLSLAVSGAASTAYVASQLAPIQASRTVQSIAATSNGQTTFVTTGYTVGMVNVYMSGVRLVGGTDYTAADGVNIVLSSTAATLVAIGTSIVVEALMTYAVANAVQANSLASSTGSSLVGFQQPGTGAVTRTVQSKLQERIDLSDFGFDSTGATDSTPALNAACASLGTNGGVIEWTGTCLINSAFTLPNGVALVGRCFNIGFQSSEIYNSTYYESILIINPSITVSMGSRSVVKNALVLSKPVSFLGAYPLPFGSSNAAAGIASFAGTAFTPLANTSDNRLEDLLVLGFSYIYDARGVTSNARPIFKHILGDCTNGIFTSNVTDDGFGENCKLWPFTTVIEGQSNQALFLRSGTAFYTELVSQGMTWVNCGSYGYAISHDVNGTRNVRQINCAVDAPAGSTSIGFQYRGAINNCINTGAEIAGQGNAGVVVNITADGNSNSINLVAANFHGSNSANGYINVLSGHLTATSCHFDGNDPNGHVNLQSSATQLSMSDCTHAGYGSVGSPIIGNATAIANAQIINAKNTANLGNPVLNQLGASTFNNTINVKLSSGSSVVGMDSAAANYRVVRYRTAGSDRWWAGANVTAESGSNAGSDYAILRYSDTGVFLGTALTITRSTGNATFSGYVDAQGGLRVLEGSNAKQGTIALTAGSAVVANTSVTATSRIFITSQVDGGTPGWLRVSARTAGTSFTITSSSASDTSTIAYEIFEPG